MGRHGGYWLLLAGIALYLGYAALRGGTGLDVLAAIAAIAATQLFPGILLWRCVRPREGWWLEDLAMGFAMGIVVAVPTQTIAGYAHHRWIAVVLPLMVAAALLGTPVTRARITHAQCSAIPWWLGGGIVLFSAAAVPSLIAFFRVNQPSWTFGTGRPQVDTYLHLALSSELLERGPAAWPTVIGEPLGYQWFTHAWIAQVTASSGVPLDIVLMRVLPAVMPIVAVSCVAALALRLTRSPHVALGAIALASLGGQTTPFHFNGPHPMVTPDSPTLGLGVPTLMALVAVLAMRWRGQAQRGSIILVPVLTVIASGTKGSTAPAVIAGLALALVAMLIWQRRLVLPLLADLAMTSVALVLTLVIVFHGSASGLKLGVGASAKQTTLAGALGGAPTPALQIIISGLTILMAVGPALLGCAALGRRADRNDPVIWVLLGSAIAGATATGIFSHPGRSQEYFLLTALPLAAIASAIGAQRVLRTLGRRAQILLITLTAIGALGFYAIPERAVGKLRSHNFHQMEVIVLVAVIVLILTAGIAMVVITQDTHRIGWRIGASTIAAAVVLSAPIAYGKYLPTTSLPRVRTNLSVNQPGVSSNAQIAAAVYIRDHSAKQDLVMTNRHCEVPLATNHCDSRRWLVTAFTQRQALIEGWTATNTATRLAPHGRDSITINYWHPALLALNDDFYTHPTAAAANKLWNLGVRWIYQENTRPHAATLAPYATRRFNDPDASAWQLKKP